MRPARPGPAARAGRLLAAPTLPHSPLLRAPATTSRVTTLGVPPARRRPAPSPRRPAPPGPRKPAPRRRRHTRPSSLLSGQRARSGPGRARPNLRPGGHGPAQCCCGPGTVQQCGCAGKSRSACLSGEVRRNGSAPGGGAPSLRPRLRLGRRHGCEDRDSGRRCQTCSHLKTARQRTGQIIGYLGKLRTHGYIHTLPVLPQLGVWFPFLFPILLYFENNRVAVIIHSFGF